MKFNCSIQSILSLLILFPTLPVNAFWGKDKIITTTAQQDCAIHQAKSNKSKMFSKKVESTGEEAREVAKIFWEEILATMTPLEFADIVIEEKFLTSIDRHSWPLWSLYLEEEGRKEWSKKQKEQGKLSSNFFLTKNKDELAKYLGKEFKLKYAEDLIASIRRFPPIGKVGFSINGKWDSYYQKFIKDTTYSSYKRHYVESIKAIGELNKASSRILKHIGYSNQEILNFKNIEEKIKYHNESMARNSKYAGFIPNYIVTTDDEVLKAIDNLGMNRWLYTYNSQVRLQLLENVRRGEVYDFCKSFNK